MKGQGPHTSSSSLIELDGSVLEGGGQLLRLALSICSLIHAPIRVTSIRGKRGPKSAPGSAGGLKPGHLAGVQWLAKATSAETVGMELRSQDMLFRPSNSGHGKQPTRQMGVWEDVFEDGALVRRQSHISMSTPGSILLVLQAILPYIVFSAAPDMHDQQKIVPLRVTIDGGTNVGSSPSIEYVSQVLLPLLSSKVGIPPVTLTLHDRGWSTGRVDVGRVTFEVQPLPRTFILSSFRFTNRGGLIKVHVSILAPDITARHYVRDAVVSQLIAYDENVEILFPVDDNSGHGKRLYLLLVGETSGGYLLGRDWLYDGKFKGSSSEKRCESLVTKVVKDLKCELEHGGCVDEHMQDQLVVFQALASQRAEVDGGRQREASLHTITARWVANKILGVDFDIDGTCDGVGYQVGAKFETGRKHGRSCP